MTTVKTLGQPQAAPQQDALQCLSRGSGGLGTHGEIEKPSMGVFYIEAHQRMHICIYK